MNINSRIPRLDALRGVAILLVLGRHLPDGPQLQIFFRIWKTIGDLGMDLFFGLSGFLVGGILLREYQQSEGRVDLERFVVRRGFKIIPGYYLLIAFWFFTSNYWDNITPDLLDLIKHLFFIHNYTGFTKQIFQTWSLAVEEQFYLFLGGLFWILMTFKIKLTFRIRKGVYLWILLALACVLARMYHHQTYQPFLWYTHKFQTHLRIDTLGLGVLIAWLHTYHKTALAEFTYQYFKLICTICLICFMPSLFGSLSHNFYYYTFGFTFSSVFAACLILLSLNPHPIKWNFDKNHIFKSLCFIGTNSYAIYLWHIYWLKFCVKVGETYGISKFSLFTIGAYLIGSIPIGYLMCRYWEQPFLKLRDKLSK